LTYSPDHVWIAKKEFPSAGCTAMSEKVSSVNSANEYRIHCLPAQCVSQLIGISACTMQVR